VDNRSTGTQTCPSVTVSSTDHMRTVMDCNGAAGPAVNLGTKGGEALTGLYRNERTDCAYSSSSSAGALCLFSRHAALGLPN
jgi:hypothetical protein